MVSKFASKTKKKYDPLRGIRWPGFWSYSRWSVANKCMARYMFQCLLKLPQPPSKPMERGSKIHKQGEHYLDGTTKNVPASYRLFSDELKAIKKLKADPEGTFAFTKTWGTTSPTDWARCWLRIKIDAFVDSRVDGITTGDATIIDFKTGRPYKDTVDQSELYAVGAFQSFPELETIDAEFWYLDSGEVVDYHYARSEFKKLKRKWATRGRALLAARQFPCTTNAYDCKYCPFRSDVKLGVGKPGPCNGWKKAK